MRKLLILLLLAAWMVPCNAQDKLYADEFSLGDVTLLDGPLKHAQDLNVQTLLQYDCDRLLAPYRKEAGLEPKAKAYPNWVCPRHDRIMFDRLDDRPDRVAFALYTL